MIPAEEKRSYEREREGDSTVALSCDPSPTDVGRPSTRSPPARLPRVALPRGMRISIVLRQKGKVRLHACIALRGITLVCRCDLRVQ